MTVAALALFAALQSGPGVPAEALLRYLKPSDYPREALLNAEQGTVVFELQTGKDGVPKGCRIVQSSGYKRLDERTCSIMVERARFRPARDKTGNPVEDAFESRITWRIGD